MGRDKIADRQTNRQTDRQINTMNLPGLRAGSIEKGHFIDFSEFSNINVFRSIMKWNMSIVS